MVTPPCFAKTKSNNLHVCVGRQKNYSSLQAQTHSVTASSVLLRTSFWCVLIELEVNCEENDWGKPQWNFVICVCLWVYDTWWLLIHCHIQESLNDLLTLWDNKVSRHDSKWNVLCCNDALLLEGSASVCMRSHLKCIRWDWWSIDY